LASAELTPPSIVSLRCALNYKRALCENPKVISDWLKLVENMKAKYGIQDENTYNFDEAGCKMGMIQSGTVVTDLERQGPAKLV
jgi:hypothetical protein